VPPDPARNSVPYLTLWSAIRTYVYLLSSNPLITLPHPMKAERRHELQTNSLALWISWKGPELAKKYGTQALLGVLIAALAVALIRWRMEKPKLDEQRAVDKLSVARGFIGELENHEIRPGDAAQAAKLINDAMEQSDTPAVQAQGYMALGDYYWNLASWPELPGAETQPSLRPELPHDELLTKAGEQYGKVLKVQGAPPYLAAAAELGLGAVKEQQAFELSRAGKAGADQAWSQAKDHYEAVAKINKAPAVLKEEARWHIDRLASLQQPLWLVPASELPAATQATQPATRPAAAAPSARPAVVPAATTQPAK
jgi:hypothetical protein